VATTRLLLIPEITELEWAIKPELEEWAEAASFDAPGVGAEPPAPTPGREAIVRRGLRELDRCGWESCVLVADGFSGAAATNIAEIWPGRVDALALGHARLSNSVEGNRAPVNREVWEALGQLLQRDYGAFVRHAIAQVTQGSFDQELADRMLERIPIEVAQAAWEASVTEDEPIGERLRSLDVPLLFAKHEGCLVASDEGFEDAVAAFPRARTVVVSEAPTVSSAFAQTLRSFCQDLAQVGV
jgi:pimeloyl-ACP methyl ester carboxylesterase